MAAYVLHLAMLAAGVCGLALGLPTLRLKEDYLAIVTLGFGVIVDLVFLNLEITGGPDGVAGSPPPSVLGLSFRPPPLYLLLTLLAVLFTLGLTYRLVQSYHGRALKAIRDHEVTAQVMGINTPSYKVAIFTLAAAVVGALALTMLPEMLRQFHAYQDLIYGALLVGLLIWRPEGLLGRGKLSLKFLSRE